MKTEIKEPRNCNFREIYGGFHACYICKNIYIPCPNNEIFPSECPLKEEKSETLSEEEYFASLLLEKGYVTENDEYRLEIGDNEVYIHWPNGAYPYIIPRIKLIY